MEGAKLDISGQTNNDSHAPTATYRPIPEEDMEEEAVTRPKSLIKVKPDKQADGADEKMLPQGERFNSAIAMSDMKASPNQKQNGDAKLDIGEVKIFGGMDKEELMKYANDPFWVRLRWFLFITFWVLWAAMLVGAVMIIYAAPKCDPPPPRTWWQEGPLTEIAPDSTPEDLKLIDNNVRGVIITCPEDAYGDIDESHDVIKLIKQAKDLDKKVVIDLDPSSSTVWFEDSERNKEGLSDFYVWKPPKNFASGGAPRPPNNWLNINNQPSWTYSDIRKEFYYSPFNKPHLNFNNPNVTDTFSDVIRKFLSFGVEGVRIRNAPFLLVDQEFKDESMASVAGYDHAQYGFYTHSRTQNLPGLGPLLKQWRAVVRNKTEDGPFMVKEELLKPDVYRVHTALVVDLPVQARAFTKPNTSVTEIINNLNHTFNIENIEWPLWVVNSTAFPKDVLDIVTNLLPGVPLMGQNEKVDTQLLKIRKSLSVMRGICDIHGVNNNTVLAFIRVTSGNPGVLVLMNSLNEKVIVNIPKEIPPLSTLSHVTVQLYSKNFNESDYMDLNAKKDATAVHLSAKSAIVLSYVPKKSE
ncbi:hypothetical protein NQ315_009782 [Exocentrus adspersus]|uniref:alpha-glucosidase n=1 Tax=Exocentrus adspersus TaxID=1586481 RepID=A0AAV8WGP4_9CUCU|nr:hypothetical protein NQ315_009782 [Exocentrus adspersus]